MIDNTAEMAEKRNPLGATGDTVRANITRIREAQNLTYAQLGRKLDQCGRAIPTLGLRRIESGERRVDVDDLMALAAALDVSPLDLLTPVAEEIALVPVTGLGLVTVYELRNWMIGQPTLQLAPDRLARMVESLTERLDRLESPSGND